MHFDERRYVAPGVPKITERFVVQHLFGKTSLENQDSKGVFDYLTKNKGLRALLTRRLRIVSESSPHIQDLSEEEILKFAKREYAIRSALCHESLVFGSQMGDPLCDETGLPLLSMDRASEFYRDYLKKAKESSNGSGYLAVELWRSNPFLADFLYRKSEHCIKSIIPDDLGIHPQKKLGFVLRAGNIGTTEVLNSLISQNRTCDLEDQFELF